MLTHLKEKEPTVLIDIEARILVLLARAIALKCFLGNMTIEGSTNGDVFRVFVEKILLKCL